MMKMMLMLIRVTCRPGGPYCIHMSMAHLQVTRIIITMLKWVYYGPMSQYSSFRRRHPDVPTVDFDQELGVAIMIRLDDTARAILK